VESLYGHHQPPPQHETAFTNKPQPETIKEENQETKGTEKNYLALIKPWQTNKDLYFSP